MTSSDNQRVNPRRIAHDWTSALLGTNYVPLSRQEIENFLDGLSSRLVDLLTSKPFEPEPAAEIGAKLVEAHFTAPEALGHTLRLIGTQLSRVIISDSESLERLDRVVRLLGELGSGYIAALRERTFEEQERMKRAMWLAADVAQRKLRESEELFLAIFEHTNIGIGIGTSDGLVLTTNSKLQRILGYDRDEFAQMSWRDMVHPEDLPELVDNITRLFAGEYSSFKTRLRMIRKNGDQIWALHSISALRDSTGSIECLVATTQDATDLHLTSQTIAILGTQDPVTGLLSRTSFLSRVETAIGRAKRGDRIALFVLGIDGFSAINDGLGITVGDEVLVVLSTRLKAYAEQSELTVARLGGDEFALLVEKSAGTRTVTRLLDEAIHLFTEPVNALGYKLSLHVSAGVVERPTTDSTPDELIGHAVTALRWAKEAGKAQWMLFDEQRFVQERLSLQLILTLPSALDNGEFFIEYQPIVGLADGKLLFLEALLRWDHPEHGLLAIEDFLPLAEQHGMGMPVSDWMLAKTCAQVKNWQERFGSRAPRVSVKLTNRQVRDPEFLANILRALDKAEASPALVQFELSTDALNGEYDAQWDDVEMLAERGIQFSINDFGTHDLGYLGALKLHFLKSRNIVVEQIAGERDPIRVRAAINAVGLAKLMGLDVIAEGVDSAEQAEWLRGIGVAGGQGNAFGGPRYAADVESLFAE